jgi:urocanate hydratase
VLDGSDLKDKIIKSAMEWDVMNGISRRAWARNDHALEVASDWNRRHKDKGHITLPYIADDDLIEKSIKIY